jgi:hypothetical protein
VESAATEHVDVEVAAAVVHTGASGVQQLLLYVTPQTTNVEALRRVLQERLPATMMPNMVLPLQSMPLTGSGKTDKKALPTPEELAKARAASDAAGSSGGLNAGATNVSARVETAATTCTPKAIGQLNAAVQTALGLPVRLMLTPTGAAGGSGVVLCAQLPGRRVALGDAAMLSGWQAIWERAYAAEGDNADLDSAGYTIRERSHTANTSLYAVMSAFRTDSWAVSVAQIHRARFERLEHQRRRGVGGGGRCACARLLRIHTHAQAARGGLRHGHACTQAADEP